MPHDNKLFVGNLPNTFKDEDVKKLFGHFGEIESFKLCPKAKSAFGFITYTNTSHANEAKKQLNNKTVHNHQIHIDFARSSNDLIIKPPPKHKKKRKFTALTANPYINPNNDRPSAKKKQNKRRKLAPTPTIAVPQHHKKIPKSRIIKITNIPTKVSMATLKHELMTKRPHQYLIYPAHESTSNGLNVAWILHKNVDDAQAMVDELDRYLFYQSILSATFVRKLNKLYRVNIIPSSITKDVTKLKRFINDYFNHNYKFDEEENKKSVKFNKYVRNRRYKKKTKQRHDVIQHVSIKHKQITIEFKKVDYALFAVTNMNGVSFESRKINTHFELETYDEHKVNNKPPKTQTSVSDQRIILKMFNIAESVQYSQLKALILSIVDAKYYEHTIYPSPDSLPQSQCAWICLKHMATAQKVIHKLNGTEINHKSVGVVYMKYNIDPQKVMIRNLPDSITKDDMFTLLKRFGTVAEISMKEKRKLSDESLISEHCGWCFVRFNSIPCAMSAMKEMNGYKLKNKTIAIDHTLPKDLYNKIRDEWKKHNDETATTTDAVNVQKEKVVIWKLFAFMKEDYETKSFFKIKSKTKVHRERLPIPIASEPTEYDWLKWFLWKHRLTIIQYETNCKIYVSGTEHVEITSCNERDLEKGVAIIKEMLNDKRIREVGYTQIINIPFALEHADFDWILYLNGDNYKSRKQFEYATGCSFTFRRKDKLQIELIGATKQSLQRGAHYMKDEILSEDIKDRQAGMEHKWIERIHFKPNRKIRELNVREIQRETKCKIRIFGSHVFENKKNVKSYFKVCAKTDDALKNGCKVVRDCIAGYGHNNEGENEEGDSYKKFWFYSGDANEGRTIFVRNLPFEVTESDSIRDKFATFGNIISVKLVRDKISGNFNGSCFIQFDNKESVQSAIRNNRLVTMNGRKLLIDVAVNKYEARKMERQKLMIKDRRNLYLAKEGIMLKEEEMKLMEKSELDRRIRSWKEKQMKLQNPNFHVSKTRLSVQNIPPFVNEKYLRKIFYDCAVGIRKKMELEKNNNNKQKDKLQVFEHPFAKINQVKIVRDTTRLNSKSGVGRSKRFGFIEFREHSDSLLVLRELNNKECAQIFVRDEEDNKAQRNNSKMKANGKLQVEFSVENMKKLHIHLEKRRKHQIKWRNANLERLRDKLDILKAQNQTDQVKKTEHKISVIMQNVNNEKYAKIKEKKAMLKMKNKKKEKRGGGLMKKYTFQQRKKHRKRAIKHD